VISFLISKKALPMDGKTVRSLKSYRTFSGGFISFRKIIAWEIMLVKEKLQNLPA